MSQRAHIDRELLLSYAMRTANILRRPRRAHLAFEDVRYVERHIAVCERCTESVEAMRLGVEIAGLVLVCYKLMESEEEKERRAIGRLLREIATKRKRNER